MPKQIFLFLLVICIAFAGISMAQEPAEQNKNILMKEISATPASASSAVSTAPAPSAVSVVGPAQAPAAAALAAADLRPALWVECYTGDFEDVLARRGFLFIKDIYVYVYNSGTRSSSAATGKIEFFDVLTNKNIVFDFSVDPVDSKKWANILPRNSLAGPYIVKKDAGVTASVTFRPTSTSASRTRTSTQKECSILY